jgi:hypothetical protein
MFHFVSHLFLYIHNVIQWLKARIVVEQVAVARQQHGNHVSTAMNKHATTEELLEAVFFVWSVLMLYSKDQQVKLVSLRLELAVGSG